MEQAHARLVLLAQVRMQLRRLSAAGLLDPAVATTAEHSLTESERQLVDGLPSVDTDSLIAQCVAAGMSAEVQVLRHASRAARLRDLQQRREAVLPAGSLDLSDVHPGLVQVPVGPFPWSHIEQRWQALANAIIDGRIDFDRLRQMCEDFFGSRHDLSIPVRTGLPLHGLVAELIKHRILPAQDAPACADDLADMTEALEFASGQMHVELSISGSLPDHVLSGTSHALFEVLEAYASMESPDADITALLMRWNGPFFAELADAWLTRRPGEDESASEHRADLLAARTGIDPFASPARWRRWVEAHINGDQLRLTALRESMHADRMIYALALAMSAGAVLGDGLKARWWPLVQNLRERRNPTPAATPEPESGESPAARSALAGAALASVVEPTHEVRTPQPEHRHAEPEAWVPELDIEFTAAPGASRSESDDLVEARSAWNIYLRPFLSENWLGLIGITSLMAAWMFLTMWLWDKGQVYRVAMGAVPLLGLTIGAAWIARFIQRLPDGAPRAVTLFATLAYLSVPFNYALGASLLTVPALSAKVAAFVSVIVYAAMTPWIAQRIRGGVGFAPTRPLLELNLLAYVPGVTFFTFGESGLPVALGATLFLGWFVVWRALRHQNGNQQISDGAFPPALAFWLQTGSFLLVVGIPHVYFRVWPDPVVIATLAQLIALGLAYAFALTPVILIGTAAISLGGVLLGLLHPAWLPLVLALATVFWFLQFRRAAWDYAHEATALHGFAFAVATAFSGGLTWLAGPFALVAMFCSRRLEHNRDSEFIHFAYPLVMALCAWSAYAADANFPSVPGLVATAAVSATAMWGHWRFSTRFRVNLYFVNIAAASAALVVTLGLADFRWSAATLAHVAVVTTTLTALWCVVTVWLRDPLTVMHRSVIQSVLGATALVLWVAAVLTSPFAGTWLPVAALLLGAALVELARRTRSMLPMAAALVVAGLAGATLKAELGLGSSGLGTATAGALMLAIAEWLRRRSELETQWGGRDQWFGRAWLLRSDRYFAVPLDVAAGLAALTGVVQAIPRLGPLDHRPAVAISIALCTIVLGRLAWRSASRWLGLLALPGLLAFSAAVIGAAPAAYMLHATALWILVLHETFHRLPRTDPGFAAGVVKPFGWLLTTVCWLFIVGALLGYPWLLLTKAEPINVLVWAALVLVVHARCIVPRWPAGLAHLVHLHLLIVVFGAPYVALGYPDPLVALGYGPFVIGAGFAVLSLIAWFGRPGHWTRAYSVSAWPWVALLAVAFTSIGFYLSVWTPVYTAAPLLALPVAAWIMFEATSRRWRGGIIELPRLLVVAWFWALFWLSTDISLMLDRGTLPAAAGLRVLFALVSTALTFWLLEDLSRRIERALGRGLPRVIRAHGITAGQRTTFIALLTLSVALAVLAHLAVSWTAATETTIASHLWLYPLIAALVWAARDANRSELAWFGVGLFAYSNCFIALEHLDQASAQGMSALHLLAGAFVFSLFVLVMLAGGLRRIYANTEVAT
ncbi:MAG: hypothetical protein AAF458_23575 [Pseudomonadota bacterium]